MARIAIVGFGFSGLMVTANLVRMAAEGTTVYVIAETFDPKGVAYRTTDAQHLLNVPAAKMGAFPDAPDEFYEWLQTPEAALAKQRLGIARVYAPTDFVPRALYAMYLAHVWETTQQLASERRVMLKLVASTATAVTSGTALAVLTARGDAIAVETVVLATGNETKPILPQLKTERIVQNPWASEVWAGAKEWTSPVALMGVGLTAVDTILSLRKAGYRGEIIAFSRHGLLPRVHKAMASLYAFDRAGFAAALLAAWMKQIRDAVAQHGEWRAVIDALRPHTQWLWQRLTLPQQKRFFRQLATLWSVHRHRMAPEIAAAMDDEMARGTTRIFASSRYEVSLKEDRLQMRLLTEKGWVDVVPSYLVNCTGPEMNVTRSAQPLLKCLLANGLIEPHGNGIGIAADPQLRAWGAAHPHLYAIGTLLTGQLLESTAVPELRVQAQAIAQAISA